MCVCGGGGGGGIGRDLLSATLSPSFLMELPLTNHIHIYRQDTSFHDLLCE